MEEEGIWLGLKLLGGEIAGWWKGLSPTIKWGAIGIVALVAGTLLHQHEAHKALKAADHAGYQRALEDVKRLQDQARAKAIKFKQKVETSDVSAADKARDDNAKDNLAIGDLADRLRKGPPPRLYTAGGSQRCVPSVPGDPGGTHGNTAALYAGLPQLPYDAAVLEWSPLVDHAEADDRTRSKLIRLQQLLRDFTANHAAAEGTANGK